MTKELLCLLGFTCLARSPDGAVLQSDAGSLESAAAELSKAASLLVSIERHIISMQSDGVSLALRADQTLNQLASARTASVKTSSVIHA